MSDSPPSRTQVITGSDVASHVDEKTDVCIVGSGAGGSVLAARLAEKGIRVVLLEEGGFFTAKDFKMQESVAYPQLYQEKGNRATADLSILILQGRAVGGSTVVNWTTSFRTPAKVLAHWHQAHGIEGLDEATLVPHWEAVEKRLHIVEQELAQVNANNRVLYDGAAKLGWSRALTRRNVNNCMNSGYCGLGCPVNAKQSMLITYLPDALRQGARLYANARAVRVEWNGKRATAVHAEVLDPATDKPNGRKIVIRPKVIVLAGGAINTPALMLRSRLDINGRVGKRTFLHPVVASGALFEERIEGFYGAPQSVSSHHFADRGPGKMGFFLETAPVHPMLTAVALGGVGHEHQDVMARLAHFNALISLGIDGFLPGDDGGTVSLRADGRVRIDYPIRDATWEALRESMKAMARIQLAAGAKEVVPIHGDGLRIRSDAELGKIDALAWKPLRATVFTAHQMGGAAMGRDPETSVVDSRLKHHHLYNLFVVDGSVFPTSLGVNPQLSIYGIAHWAADHVAAAVNT